MSGLSWLWRDLRFGLRSLGKDPRFTALAIVVLALGIAAATVIFSVLDSVILEPFPYRDSNRLAVIVIHDVTHPDVEGTDAFTLPELMDFREQNSVFQDIAGVGGFDVLYTDGAQTQLFDGGRVTPNMFEFLGVKPLLGRWLTEEDGKTGASPVFAITYRLWARQFNRDPKILGTTMVLNGEPRTLVGIMPPRWLLLNRDVFIPVPWSHKDVTNAVLAGLPLSLTAIGRFKPGENLRSAAADFDVLAKREAATYPKNFPVQFTVLPRTLAERIGGTLSKTLYLLLAAAGTLLLIACSNVSNLLLARSTVREKEIAIRAALGASPARIVLQLLVESSILAFAGCALGCLIAYAGVRGAAAAIPPGWYAFEAVIEMKPSALIFAVGVAMLTTVLSGLAPAIHAVRGSLHARLSDSGKGVSGSFRHGKFRNGLVVAEVALSILMLVGAGLTMRSLLAMEREDLGFNPANILVARIPFPPGRYDSAQGKRLFFQQALPRVAALPGAISATETITLPPYGGLSSQVTVPGKTHSEQWNALLQLCSEGYFRTLELRAIGGRMLSDVDVDSARHVLVINQTLARNYFKDEDPIGKTIKFNVLDQISDAPHDAYFEIIGIVRDAKNQGLRNSLLPEAWAPYTLTGAFNRGILVRTTADPLLLLPGIRRVIAGIDSTLPLTLTGSLEGYLAEFSYAEPRFGLISMGAFAVTGLLLVVIGVFSMMAYTVSLQTHDIGVRMALGAQRNSIVRMVLKRGLILVGAGILIGSLVSFAVMRVAASQFWGVSASDPWTFGAAVVLLIAVGVGACLVPARRATRVDPIVALRYE